MAIELIQVPWDTARRGVRMGAGPGAIVSAGAVERLRAHGPVHQTVIGADPLFEAEIATGFELAGSVAHAVRMARGRGALPIVLAGNCLTAAGVVAALPKSGTGVVWLDAHADLNTPDTTTSGFLDGMALSVVLGNCWGPMARRIDGFSPVDDRNVMLVGARDLDPGEQAYLDGSEILTLSTAAARDRTEVSWRLATLASRVQRVYLHVDLDVHDPFLAGHANSYAAAHGLRADEVQAFVRQLASRIPIAAAALTAYDPSADRDGRMLANALDLLDLIAQSAVQSPSAE
jgi:arginase